MDVVGLDESGKCALQRSYSYVFTEKKPYDTDADEACRSMLQTVFGQFAENLERDLRRTRF